MSEFFFTKRFVTNKDLSSVYMAFDASGIICSPDLDSPEITFDCPSTNEVATDSDGES